MKANRSTSTHIIVKMAKMKDKDRSLKVARENQRVIFKRNTIRPSAEFSAEIVQAIREWCAIGNMLKRKTLQPWIPHPARLSFRIEEK